MNYLPGANLLTRQLRTGIIFYRFLILIFGLFPPMDTFFKIIILYRDSNMQQTVNYTVSQRYSCSTNASNNFPASAL